MNVRSIINVKLLVAAIIVGIIGYVLLAVAPIDNALSWTVAPFVLVFCYLVMIPLAVLLKKANVENN
ncbi:MAG: hypothetical protein LBH98_06520 [Chitinispirillales bacterium]|nr:hypothetical protein [Chitinispirillales bacterium]